MPWEFLLIKKKSHSVVTFLANKGDGSLSATESHGLCALTRSSILSKQNSSAPTRPLSAHTHAGSPGERRSPVSERQTSAAGERASEKSLGSWASTSATCSSAVPLPHEATLAVQVQELNAAQALDPAVPLLEGHQVFMWEGL